MSQMEILINLLSAEGIPFEVSTHWSETPQVFYPTIEDRVCDVISFYGSYGGAEGLLEIYGLSGTSDGVEGWLTAEEIFNRINNHYMIEVI